MVREFFFNLAVLKFFSFCSSLGAKVALLNQDELKERFPFMNFTDVICGTIGLENEGAIDSWQVLQAFREKNIELGLFVD